MNANLQAVSRYLRELMAFTYRLMADKELDTHASLTIMAQMSASMVARAKPAPGSPTSKEFFIHQFDRALDVYDGWRELGKFGGGENDNFDAEDSDGGESA